MPCLRSIQGGPPSPCSRSGAKLSTSIFQRAVTHGDSARQQVTVLRFRGEADGCQLLSESGCVRCRRATRGLVLETGAKRGVIG